MRFARFAVPLAAALAAAALLSHGRVRAAGGSTEAAALDNNFGVAYMNQQLPEKALHKFEDAGRTDPSSAIPVVNEGLAYLYLRKLPEAEDTLKKAVALDPKSVRGWYSLGVTHFSGGSEDAAFDDFQKAAVLDPGDADIHYFLGTILLSKKEYPEAIEQFQTTVGISPFHASAQFGMARALQREGKVDEAREHLARFQQITQAKIGTLMSATYGEQGHYALVEDMLALPKTAGPMIAVSFQPTAPLSAAGKPGEGGGLCMLDLDGSGARGLISMQADGLHAYRLAASGTPELVDATKLGLAVKGSGIACAVGDFDNDTLPDLAVATADHVQLFKNLGQGKWTDVTEKVGLAQRKGTTGITFVDFDHDGDLDLFLTGAGGSTLWRNNGNSSFTEWTGPTALAGSASTSAAKLSDINNDRAVDLVVAGAAPSPTVYKNQREGAFKPAALYSEALPASRALALADWNKDGYMDVAVAHAGAPGLSLWRSDHGERFERIPVALPGVTAALSLTPIDFDNDGWVDLAALVETTNGPRIKVLRNTGAGGFVDVSDALGLSKLAVPDASSLLAADVDGDGAPDLLVGQNAAPPLVLHNAGGAINHSLRIALTGLADNKSAIGAKVEVFAGGNWQKFEVTTPSDILAGLGRTDHADVVRLLWPTGVPQDELEIAANKPLALTELDRRGSSCPVLFAWDGEKYAFVSDVIGAGVVGHWISPSAYNQPDSNEWTKVDGALLKPRNGLLSVRFGEPMEEINYVDQLRLVAIDHPAGTEAYTDEKFLSAPPFASGKPILASAQAHLPAAATDALGRDALPVLAERDHTYLRDFTNLSYAGFANDHALTLDLGPLDRANPVRLFLSGYIEYFSASSMYAAWQAGLAPQSPSVEAQTPDGRWKPILADMGFPAGLPRTITVDLTGKLPQGARRIRIRTNLQIYWDQILVDNAPSSDRTIRATELPLREATLAFRGYPQQIDGKTPGDLTYDYQNISLTGPFGWQRGAYTRYGTVTPLLTGRDNHDVIFGSGEDIDAEFDTAALPPLPAGWTRDYFFYADGFVKDRDFWQALPFTVAEMPCHGIRKYPSPGSEQFPSDAATVTYRLDWDDRMETGDRIQRYQFRYQRTLSEPIQTPPENTRAAK